MDERYNLREVITNLVWLVCIVDNPEMLERDTLYDIKFIQALDQERGELLLRELMQYDIDDIVALLEVALRLLEPITVTAVELKNQKPRILGGRN